MTANKLANERLSVDNSNKKGRNIRLFIILIVCRGILQRYAPLNIRLICSCLFLFVVQTPQSERVEGNP